MTPQERAASPRTEAGKALLAWMVDEVYHPDAPDDPPAMAADIVAIEAEAAQRQAALEAALDHRDADRYGTTFIDGPGRAMSLREWLEHYGKYNDAAPLRDLADALSEAALLDAPQPVEP